MDLFYDKTAKECVSALNSDEKTGLSEKAYAISVEKYGKNTISKKKERGFFSRVFIALKEPMLIILLFSFVIAFGTDLGKYLKTGKADFAECLGILSAVVLSVAITLIMEGSSKKAFDVLNRVYDGISVKIIRNGEIRTVKKDDLAKGDIVLLESGDKIVADGRLIESVNLTVDESALTGESSAVSKNADTVLNGGAGLAERVNSVFSGTFVKTGTGKMIVTHIGDETEIGRIAGELVKNKEKDSPLEQKLSRLGKIIAIIGAISATVVFLISATRLFKNGELTFDNIRELFISCIVLIVAAVPEGLPTIVAVSLALNMIKLTKENALIKKMVAAETMGAVSVICSDKTGTLTQNKMKVVAVESGLKEKINKKTREILFWNFVLNSTADKISDNGKSEFRGGATECALLEYAYKNGKYDIMALREKYPVEYRLPFSSEIKKMVTVVKTDTGYRGLIKGAPEKILPLLNAERERTEKITSAIKEYQKKSGRVLCFAHFDFTDFDESAIGGKIYEYDGFAVIKDPVRPEVKKSVKDCYNAGIKVKMLTGDNYDTAYAIAKELSIADSEMQVINAKDLEGLDDETFKKVLKRITVISRSTPIIKLRVVKALKEMGEVVAVTGDGTNDAPAIKHADIGIAMGISGSEITKESADMILLDDSFSTVIKAVSFGRNVYRNLQRFILFQLSVNFTALLFITVCAVTGMPTPFNTLQLLWINIIMDGPPALTLGLESPSDKLLTLKPVKRTDGIVGVKMLLRILFNGLFMGGILIFQYATNFLGATEKEKGSAVFTLFILFQLFNAFNSRELGAESILKRIGKNKIMVGTFTGVFFCHLLIVQIGYGIFGISPMSFSLWIKCILLSSTIITVSEIGKLVYRTVKKNIFAVRAGKILDKIAG